MEKNYWAIHMGENNKYADIAYENKFIGIGWEIKDLTNFRDLSNRQFKEKTAPLIKNVFPDKSINALGQITGQLYRFSNLMKIGDIVLVPYTQENKVYAGVIDSDYFYQAELDTKCPFQHRRKVKWLKIINYNEVSQALRNSLGSIMTTFSISDHENEIEKLLSEDIEQLSTEGYKEFGLESHLEEFLVNNWDKLNLGKKYSILEEEGKIIGQQYVTSIGRIDILAKSNDNNEWLIIELKKGKSDDQVVGQVLRYIGWIKENLAEEKETVRGLIITKDKDDRLLYALKTLINVSLMTYTVRFDLKEER